MTWIQISRLILMGGGEVGQYAVPLVDLEYPTWLSKEKIM